MAQLGNPLRIRCIAIIAFFLLFIRVGYAQDPFTETLLTFALARQIARNAGASLLSKQMNSLGTRPTPETVRRITERLGAQFKKSFRVTILRDDTFNAACYPNGDISINSGLLKEVGDDEDVLAAILGHEIAHFTHEHTVNSFRRELVLNAGLRALVRNGDAANPLLIKAAQAVLASYSRDDELEADRLGLVYLIRAGYNPEGAVRAFEIMSRVGSDSASFFASHPRSVERAEKQRKYLAAYKAGVPLEWIAEGKTSKDIEERIGQAPELPVSNSALLSIRLNNPTDSFNLKVFPRFAILPLIGGYLTVYSHTPEGKLRRLFPNPYVAGALCVKDEWTEIPSMKYRTPKGDFVRLRWESAGSYRILFILTEADWDSAALDGKAVSREQLATTITEACKNTEIHELKVLELTVKGK